MANRYTTWNFYIKLDYIHHNSVSGKWSLCDDFVEYLHSSAAFYELERPHPHMDITDYRDLFVNSLFQILTNH